MFAVGILARREHRLEVELVALRPVAPRNSGATDLPRACVLARSTRPFYRRSARSASTSTKVTVLALREPAPRSSSETNWPITCALAIRSARSTGGVLAVR